MKKVDRSDERTVIFFSASRKGAEYLAAQAKAQGVHRSELIRRILSEWISKQKRKVR